MLERIVFLLVRLRCGRSLWLHWIGHRSQPIFFRNKDFTLFPGLGFNFLGWRLHGYETAVLPWGILLSGFAVLVVAATGWHGGKLVFDYRLGTSKGNGRSSGD